MIRAGVSRVCLASAAAAFLSTGSRADPVTPAASAPPAANPMTVPSYSYPLAANPQPLGFDAGPLGKIYVTGAVTGLGILQDNIANGDRHAQVDISNGQVFIQNTAGLVQFFIEAGAYSLPSIGAAYIRSGNAINDYYGALPQAFLKIAPTANFSVEAGKLPTLIGAEYTFTFENTNIERGLLWNQETAVSRGVQANYTAGPVAFAVSLNDGFYSNRYNWLSGSATWTVNSNNTLAVAAGGNLGTTATATIATPLAQNNGEIYNIIYTYSNSPLTLQPYLQYTRVPTNAAIGITHEASTFGAALLGNYAFTPRFSLAGRVEYILSNGSLADGAPNLLYGPGSKAASVTITPTYQYKVFFGRAEFSFVKAFDTVSGSAFGASGLSTTQERGVLETGILF